MFRKFVLLGAALALLAAPAAGQVNTVPATGVQTNYLARVTYSAVFIGLAPAASATDVVCIAGSTSKTIRLQSIRVSGSSGTTLSFPLTLLRRVTLDTAGTPAATTANPANTISKRDVGSPTATATLVSYTANPTINDASPTYIASAQAAIALTTMATVGNETVFDFAKDTENFLQAPTITQGVTGQLCLNMNAVTLASGLLTGSITWTEE